MAEASEHPLTRWTGLRSEGRPPLLVLGAMNFGGGTPEPEALSIVDRAIERGITLVDTANAYTDGESERIVGRAKKRHPDLLVATKVGFGTIGKKPEGLAPERVLAAADESRRRLGVEVIDLYYLHVPDDSTPIERTLDAVQQLLQRGVIRAFGVSNFASWQILEMFVLCERSGVPRPVISQVIYNLLVRQLEIEYLRFARRYALHTTIYNPLAGGLLSGRYSEHGPVQPNTRFAGNRRYQRRYWSERAFERVRALGDIAASEGSSLIELAYAWLASRPGVDSILVGPRTIDHLDAAIDAVARPISPEAIARIDRLEESFAGTDAVYARSG